MKMLKKALSAAMSVAMSAMLFINSVPADFSIVNAADSMRNITSQELVSDMGLGWNLGNSFDGYYGGQTSQSPSSVENLWGNPTVTKELIQAVKGHGFKTIRVPVTWFNCMDDSGNIQPAFLDRVQEVVDYCINEGLYVVLNDHWDGADTSQAGPWLRKAKSDYANVSARYKKMWEGISARFADYSDYLILESMNEVEFASGNPGNEDYEVFNKLNQLFVDTVRASGSNNANRHLLIAGYVADVDKTCDNRFKMPTDPADRCIVSVHYYTPADFCVATPGTSWGFRTTWGTTNDYTVLNTQLDKVKTRFVDAGIPVIVGEYGVLTESKNQKDAESITAYLKAVAENSLKRGMCPILWDSGGGDMQFIDRTTKKWHNDAIGALYKELSETYSEAATTPVVTKPTAENNSVKVVATKDSKTGNMLVDLTPYIGKLITGVGFTVNGTPAPYNGNGAVQIGMNVYDDSSTWGGSWKGIQAPFLGADVGQEVRYTFDAANEDSVDPTQIMYDSQTLSFSISWVWSADKTVKPANYSVDENITLYFDGTERETTTNALESKFAERVTATVAVEDITDEKTGAVTGKRPSMRIDISKYKGNKLVGVKFNLTGEHANGSGAVSYNLIDETAAEGTAWAYTPMEFNSSNDPIYVTLSDEHSNNLDYDYISFNVWWYKDGDSKDDPTYGFDPNVTLFFENEVVISTEPPTEPPTDPEKPTDTTVSTEDTTPTESTTPSVTENLDKATLYGDVDLNGSVEVADVVRLNTFLITKEEKSLGETAERILKAKSNADVDRNNKVEVKDSSMILDCIAEILTQDDLGKLLA